MKKLLSFLREARSELRKASWPKWESVSSSTIIVFITVIIITTFIFFIDYIINLLLKEIL